MDVIKRIGLIICILMVLMAYLKQAIPRGKIMMLMRSIISLFILVSIIDGVRNLNFDQLKNIFDQPFQNVAEDSASEIAKGLINEFNVFLMDQGLNSKVINITVSDESRVTYVKLTGHDSTVAKELISARYHIKKQNIEVKNE